MSQKWDARLIWVKELYQPGIIGILPGKNPANPPGGFSILMLVLGIPGWLELAGPGGEVPAGVAVAVVLVPELADEEAIEVPGWLPTPPNKPDMRLFTISATTVSLFCWVEKLLTFS